MSKSQVPSKRPADTQEAAWVADEDRFVLQQAKKKAAIRVRAGRAQPIDLLAVTLAVIDPEKNPLDNGLEDADLDVLDPEAVFDGLEEANLVELEKGIDTYVALESARSNQEYWNMMKTISRDRRQQSKIGNPSARAVTSVASDLDKLLASKNLEELEKLEKQIQAKLSSNEPIDTDYWEQLLSALLTYKARAKLRDLTKSIVSARLEGLRKHQAAEAAAFGSKLEAKLSADSAAAVIVDSRGTVDERHTLDPEPLLRLRSEDKSLESLSEAEFGAQIVLERNKVLKLGYIPVRNRVSSASADHALEPATKRLRVDGGSGAAQSSTSLFDREVARGLNDNEEIFTAEEPVETRNKSEWAHQYRPRKPRYFNRVISGYEWNKYNQTHYDHDNPPPKVVQGYKFNIFYPDLVDKLRAPTYRIERENGRKRGQTFAPAGENDTCLIRFIAGPPYEDIAFRIMDREWDFSAKRERGFKSSFDKGILLLHFQFKKVYYRK